MIRLMLVSLLLAGCQSFTADTLLCVGVCVYREREIPAAPPPPP